MNELDSEVMAGKLLAHGFLQVKSEDLADIIIFNTCSIRDLAERKVMGKLGQLGRNKKKDKIIGVTGCMVMAKKDVLFRKFPHVDFLIGTNNVTNICEVIDEVITTKRQVLRVDDKFEDINYMDVDRTSDLKAYVSIIRGCDKFCTYCVVPYTRGQEVSRSPESILAECKRLADEGYKEITLLGQNVNSYGKDNPQWGMLFHDLLYAIDKIDGIARVRFMTSHPIDITVDLMYALRDLKSSCSLVHFPIQAGSNRILKKMHRIYTKEQYFEKVSLLKQIVPDVVLGTDIIVGFPTETEEEFLETMQVFEDVRYHVAFLYTYSPRQGTPAMRWKDDVPEDVKNDRLQRLLRLYRKIAHEEREKLIGKTMNVLIDKASKHGDDMRGRTRCWKKVIVPKGDISVGDEIDVEITGVNNETLVGTLHSIFMY